MTMQIIMRMLSSGFFVGYLPYAPGTWASIVALIFFWFVPINSFLDIFILLGATIMSIFIATKAEAYWGVHDDKRIVIDEWIGCGWAICLIPHEYKYYLAALALFRVFDITKPFFIKKAELLKRGYGIMADDVVAGICAAIVLRVFIGFGL
ncbi:MAG: phosphatidylglycerophosphatase A [Elusimicrobiota bacterium]